MSEPLSHTASPGDASAAAQPLGQRADPTRGQLLARAVAAGGALTAGGILLVGLPKLAASQPSPAQDARVIEWLLQVEYIQAGF